MDPHVKSEKRGALGLLTLNRPQALNALTHGMIRALAAQLAQWAADDAVACVAIRGAGRAFCAGGDVRAIRAAVIAGSDGGAALLRDEYHLNALIGAYPKPYIALLHGITFGGGAGVSVHGRLRLADASLTFAMPETGIGFFPDVGGSYFLSRCPGAFGLYLGLTGLPIGLGDAMACGLVSDAVPAANFDALLEMLAQGAAAGDAVAAYRQTPPPAALAAQRDSIDAIFSAASVEDILARLDRDASDFATATAQTLRLRSPTALKAAFRQIRLGADRDLKQCLEMEYALGTRLIASHDFHEGVRAALIDKDRAPQWQPASLAQVCDIDTLFAQTAKLF